MLSSTTQALAGANPAPRRYTPLAHGGPRSWWRDRNGHGLSILILVLQSDQDDIQLVPSTHGAEPDLQANRVGDALFVEAGQHPGMNGQLNLVPDGLLLDAHGA